MGGPVLRGYPTYYHRGALTVPATGGTSLTSFDLTFMSMLKDGNDCAHFIAETEAQGG